MTEKKARTPESEQLEIVKKLRPIDDCFFEVMMEDPDACEELLQVILENPLLRIKKNSVSGQKSFRIIGKRSVRVDAYAEGNEEEVFNIEIQRADNDNHVKRVRYNASAITVKCSEPGDRFDHVQELYVIYIADFDVLGNGRTISHAEMVCKETGVALNDGLHEIFVTTVGREKGAEKISRLMREFLNPNMDNREFPKMSKRVQEMKSNPEEVQKMCSLVEEYGDRRMLEGRIEGRIQEAVESALEYGLSREDVIAKLVKKFDLTKEEASKYYEQFSLQLV